MYYYYRGSQSLYKMSFKFSSEEMTSLQIVEITEEEYNEELALLENE